MNGVGAAKGLAIGKAVIQYEIPEIIARKCLDSAAEVVKLEQALQASEQQLDSLIAVQKADPQGEADIFVAHKMFFSDPDLLEKLKEKILAEQVTAEWAVKVVFSDYMEIFAAMDNTYMQERVVDLKDVADRIIRNIIGTSSIDYNGMDADIILIVKELTPSVMASIPKDKIKGIIMEEGGLTSHTIILANLFEIPTVIRAGSLSNIKNGDEILVNGSTGEFFVNPEEAVSAAFKENMAVLIAHKKALRSFVGKESFSKDGIKVEIACNIGAPEDVEIVKQNDGEAIGLYRSEFLYMNRTKPPTEEEQFSAYAKVLKDMQDKKVIIRTLDVGGDKALSYLEISAEENPFLGYRAVRYCLDHPEIFKTQLRALLRASIYGQLLIMIPMISGVEEVRKVKAILLEVKKELKTMNIPFASNIKFGIMIEVPAAAVISDILAKEVDFFSIGTNDLIQYTIAVDRMNSSVAPLYSPYHPAVLRLINQVITNAHASGIWCGMCGAAAGERSLVPLWLGMGLDEFSVTPSNVLEVRALLAELDAKYWKENVEKILASASTAEVIEKLKELKAENGRTRNSN